MERTSDPAVNSRQWWEEYFAGQWEANQGRAQTTYFMELLLDALPLEEHVYLAENSLSILDWGCAFGEGVNVLAKRFPHCRVVGMDFAERAIVEARRTFPSCEFLHSETGIIDQPFDVVICSNCLEHVFDPLSLLRRQLGGCRKLYVAMVPYRELPLDPAHFAQFREECFPECVEGFTRLAEKVLDCDPTYWHGRMLLVVYGSKAYLSQREKQAGRLQERRKWDEYYAALPSMEMDEAMRNFGEEFAARVAELLPEGGKVLEAGCGAGWQSLVLADNPTLQPTLLDFSPEALNYARRSFEMHKKQAEFILGDVFQPGKPAYDLVFNAGVLEHYGFEEQVAFLRGMASRSRRYVLVLVPNRHCYWYWLWRTHLCAQGAWPYGREAPVSDLAAVFEAAGLQFLGQWYGGSKWSENFIKGLSGIDKRLQEEIIALHHSPLIPEREKAYLVAALGAVTNVPEPPACWQKSRDGSASVDQLTAALADAFSTILAAEHRSRTLQTTVEELQRQLNAETTDKTAVHQKNQHLEERLRLTAAELSTVKNELTALKSSRGYRLLLILRRLRSAIIPPGSRREKTARKLWRGVRALLHPRAILWPRLRTAFHQLMPNPAKRSRNSNQGRLWPHSAKRFTPQEGEVQGLVSVVLPVYNHAQLLPAAIESVLAQTYPHFELIIVNDGSTDGVEAVLARYAGDRRVRILCQPNQKLPAALSNGFEFARGEFWTWTSADNLMHPEQLRRQVKFLQAHPEVGMVYADYTVIDSAGRPYTEKDFRPHNRRSPHDPEIHLPPTAEALGKNIDNFIGPCFLYRARLGKLLGPYDPTLGIEDFEYWLRLKAFAPLVHLDSDEPLYQYRVHNNSLSAQAAELKIIDHVQELIEYNREREAFFARPWIIHADDAMLPRLQKIPHGEHHLAAWNSEPLETLANEKHLLVVHADSLPKIAENRRAGETVPVAAWFPDDSQAVCRYLAGAQGSADVCFAGDKKTYERLQLLMPHVFQVAGDEKLLELALAWANVRRHLSAAREQNKWARTLPRVFHPHQPAARVLLQADDFTQGGMEQVVLDLARSLREEGFAVSLLILGREGPDAERVRKAGIEVLNLPEEGRKEHYHRLLQERRIDVINAHYSLYGAEIACVLGIPFVQTIHNAYVFLPPEGCAAYRANDCYTGAYLCVSQMAAHYAEMKLGLPVEKMILAPNGIDLEKLASAVRAPAREELRAALGLQPQDFVFLNVSTLQPLKCQHQLVAAFAQVKHAMPEAKLVLVGRAMSSAYLKRVEETISRHGLERSVLLVGHRSDALRFYAAADAFVLPSLCEGWSLALAEALASGLPAAATTVGSAPDLLPKVGGRLIPTPFGAMTELEYANLQSYAERDDPAFVAEITAAMKSLAEHPQRLRLSEPLYRSFDYRQAFRLYGQVFLWLLQGGHPSQARAWTPSRLPDCRTAVKNEVTSLSGTEPTGAKPSIVIRETGGLLSRRWVPRWSPFWTPGVLLGGCRRLAVRCFPVGTRRGDCLRTVLAYVRRAKNRLFNSNPKLTLSQILGENEDRRGIVVCLPPLDWRWMRQRPQQLAAGFAASGYLTFYYSPCSRSDRFSGYTQVARRLYLCDSLAALYDLPEVILLVSWPRHWKVVKRFRSPFVLYDYLDSIDVQAGGKADEKIRELHRKLLVRADIISATAHNLYEEVRRFRPDAIYCPNGADYDHFHQTAPPPKDMAEIVAGGKPIIGYFGALAQWFDYELLAYVAAARRDYVFVLIGPDLDGSVNRQARLFCLPNVHWLGMKDYDSLPAYLCHFDAAIIPFVVNEVTSAVSPVKLFEYLAGGKPVVCTDLCECRGRRGVFIAQNAEEFASCLDQALELGKQPEFQHLVDAEARANTWESRLALILKRVESLQHRQLQQSG